MKHWQVPDAMKSHQTHAFLDRMSRRDLDELAGKDFPYRSLLRRLAFERDLARVIPFRQDTQELLLIGDQQRADIFVGHHLDGFKNGRLGGNAGRSAGLQLWAPALRDSILTVFAQIWSSNALGFVPHPGGMRDNSPMFQHWGEPGKWLVSPEGTVEGSRAVSATPNRHEMVPLVKMLPDDGLEHANDLLRELLASCAVAKRSTVIRNRGKQVGGISLACARQIYRH